MRLFGIDYGTKRVGLALSDESGRFAFPYRVLTNTGSQKLTDEIAAVCQKEKVRRIVLGESRNYRGEANPVMKQIETLKKRLVEKTGLPVTLEPEFLTSAEAERLQGKTAEHDAAAAALILKSYIDKYDLPPGGLVK